jgi:hypothetical protein
MGNGNLEHLFLKYVPREPSGRRIDLSKPVLDLPAINAPGRPRVIELALFDVQGEPSDDFVRIIASPHTDLDLFLNWLGELDSKGRAVTGIFAGQTISRE